MLISNTWQDYELIEATDKQRLERWGDFILVRPDPQAIWKYDKKSHLWQKPNAIYHRSKSGGGSWEFINLPEQWTINYKSLTFNLKPFSFKHTGIFPEQAVNWEWLMNNCKKRNNPKILNLFAYTGGATLACASAGASVVHVDASKGMVGWAKENAISSNLECANIRWLVDDCLKFVKREIRRGNKYDGIIMDPPSYGRGPNKEVWTIEDKLQELISLCKELLVGEPLFFLINSYTTGLPCGVLEYILKSELKGFKGKIYSDELGLPCTASKLILPCGCSARFEGI